MQALTVERRPRSASSTTAASRAGNPGTEATGNLTGVLGSTPAIHETEEDSSRWRRQRAQSAVMTRRLGSPTVPRWAGH